ncbi:unnamed protein product [Schistosoma rodhaini]|nr:unnamed protein product [Schistosoma rodhaini]
MSNDIPKRNRLTVYWLGVPDHVRFTTEDTTSILILQLATSNTYVRSVPQLIEIRSQMRRGRKDIFDTLSIYREAFTLGWLVNVGAVSHVGSKRDLVRMHDRKPSVKQVHLKQRGQHPMSNT